MVLYCDYLLSSRLSNALRLDIHASMCEAIPCSDRTCMHLLHSSTKNIKRQCAILLMQVERREIIIDNKGKGGK
jgi:hypothetical protein